MKKRKYCLILFLCLGRIAGCGAVRAFALALVCGERFLGRKSVLSAQLAFDVCSWGLCVVCVEVEFFSDKVVQMRELHGVDESGLFLELFAEEVAQGEFVGDELSVFVAHAEGGVVLDDVRGGVVEDVVLELVDAGEKEVCGVDVWVVGEESANAVVRQDDCVGVGACW